MCKKPKNCRNELAYGYVTPFPHKTCSFSNEFDCISCKINKSASCFNMKSKFVEDCTSTLKIARANHSHKSSSTSSLSKSCEILFNKYKQTLKLNVEKKVNG